MEEPADHQAEHGATPEVDKTDQNDLNEEKSQQHAESGGDTVAAAVGHGDTSTAEVAARQPTAETVHLAEVTSNNRTSVHLEQTEHQQAFESATQSEQQEAVLSAEQEHKQDEAPAAADTHVEKPAAQQQDHPKQQHDDHQAAVHVAGQAAEAAAADEPRVAAAEADHPKASSGRSSSSGGAETPAKPAHSPKKSVHSADAGAKPAAPEAPHAAEHQAAVDSPSKSPQGQHKETAVERLTTPTAMRMQKTLEQTQGGKDEWHMATGVPFKSKKLSPDEMSAMVDRLCTPKHESDNLPPKPHAVKLVFEGNKEVLVPVKETSKDDNIAYMANLYERCQETRAKTKQTLQEKWLKPLIQPKQASTSAK